MSQSTNFFFNDEDIIRSAYKPKQYVDKSQSSLPDFEVNTMLASQESFDKNNNRINELQTEVRELRIKLKTVYEKEQQIIELQQELNNNKDKDKKINILSKALLFIKNENKSLSDSIDNLKIQNLELNTIKHENTLLKQKLKENLIENPENKDKIKVNSIALKKILCNRLKNFHEKHIDDLLESHKLTENGLISKEEIENLLTEAIHI